MTKETPRWGYLGYEPEEIPGTPKPEPNLPRVRDEEGKWRKGSSGNLSGKNTKLNKLRDAVIECVTAADLHAIMRKQIELAKEGNQQAATFVFERTFGKTPNVKLVEEKSVNVQIRNLSARELEQLEEMAFKAVEAEARVIEDK